MNPDQALIDRFILLKIYHGNKKRGKKHDCRATGAFVKVLVIIFDK